MSERRQREQQERAAEQERLKREAGEREQARVQKEMKELQKRKAQDRLEDLKKTAVGARALADISVEVRTHRRSSLAPVASLVPRLRDLERGCFIALYMCVLTNWPSSWTPVLVAVS